jgi:hypothetical protein
VAVSRDLLALCLTKAFADVVPSNGTKLIIGTGANPPSEATALEGALKFSKKLQAQYRYMNQTYYIRPYVPASGE